MTDDLDFDAETEVPPEELPAQWIPRDDLSPNNWNPNEIETGDLHALKNSIVQNGWTMPLVVLDNGTIVDGEQRWKASAFEEVVENADLTPEGMDAGMVPVHGVEMDGGDARVATVQHNRARGHLSQDRLTEYLKDLDSMGVVDDAAEVLNIGQRRVRLLVEDATSANEIGTEEDEYSTMWEPTDVTDTDESELETETRSDAVRNSGDGDGEDGEDEKIERVVCIFNAREAGEVEDVLGDDAANELMRLVDEVRTDNGLREEFEDRIET